MYNTELFLWAMGTLIVAVLQFLKEGVRESWYLFLGAFVFFIFFARRMIKKYCFTTEEANKAEEEAKLKSRQISFKELQERRPTARKFTE